MTRPRTVPSTVSIALDTTNLWVVIEDTSDTTTNSITSTVSHAIKRRVGARTGPNGREEEDLRPDVVDDSSLEFLHAPSHEDWVRGNHDESPGAFLGQSRF